MENREHFGALTERMQAFREAVLDEKPYIDAERALLATEAYKAHQNQPNVMKRALMLQNILEKMSIYIEDKTRIVGNQATKNRNAPIFPEYTMEFVMKELDAFEKRDGDVFYITEETLFMQIPTQTEGIKMSPTIIGPEIGRTVQPVIDIQQITIVERIV